MFFALGLPWLGETLSWLLSRTSGWTDLVFLLDAASASQGVAVLLVLLLDGRTLVRLRDSCSSRRAPQQQVSVRFVAAGGGQVT